MPVVLAGLIMALHAGPSLANCRLSRTWNDRIKNYEILPGNVLKVGKLKFELDEKIQRDNEYLLYGDSPPSAVHFELNPSKESPYTVYNVAGQRINVAWLHDLRSGRLTKVYEDRGRPFITTEWLEEKIFAVWKQSIHSSRAYVINVENPSKSKKISGLLHYDRESRIYVGLKFLTVATDQIVVGKDLFRKETEESFVLPDLDRPRLSWLKCLFIRKDHVEVIYMNKQSKRTTRKFYPKFMQAKK